MGFTEVEGKEIDLNKKNKFVSSKKNYRPTNHYRRIKRAYEKSGDKGVEAYCNQVMELHKSTTQHIEGMDYGRAQL